MQQPDGSTILDGYRSEIMNGFEEVARYNPVSSFLFRQKCYTDLMQKNDTRPQSSQLLNVNDPIQVHLLVETALGDAKEYEILAPEEVDDLKRQIRMLTQRISLTKQSLTLQSKYRDAAISMTKLYSPPGRKGAGQDKRRSLLGHKKDSSDAADMERIASERKCEELATELYQLEKRLMVPQKRMLKHTAGILQMTHKGPKKSKIPPSQPGGMPGSPDSMYTYHKRNSSAEPPNEDNFLDERSFYKTAGQLDVYNGVRDVDGSSNMHPSKEHMQVISKTEQKLEELNKKLRQTIIKGFPEDSKFGRPPSRKSAQGKPDEAADRLQSHLEYLEKGLTKLEQGAGQSTKKHKDSEAAMEETLDELNREIRNVLLPYDSSRPEPPKLSGTDLEQQLLYFQDSVNAVEMELARAANVSSRNIGNQENIDQMESILIGLWDMVQAGQQEIAHRKQQRLQKELATGIKEEASSDDEEDDPNEPFSLQAFSLKFRWLYSQATTLKEQKKVLQRQIKQQRELNSKSDATKDAEIEQKMHELNLKEQEIATIRQQLNSKSNATKDAEIEQKMHELNLKEQEIAAIRQQLIEAKAQLAQAKADLEDAEQAHAESNNSRESGELTQQALSDELAHRNRLLAVTERELQSLKADRNKNASQIADRLVLAETKIADLTMELAVAQAAQSRVAANESKIADLTMELAVAQEAQGRVAANESKIAALQSELAHSSRSKELSLEEAESRIADLSACLAETESAHQVIVQERTRAINDRDKVQKEAVAFASERDAFLQGKEAEMENLHMEVARLQTEVTIARAELDGAYGSRAQRAAEVAANPAIQKEIDDLTRRNQELAVQIGSLQNQSESTQGTDMKVEVLEKELKEVLEEYESMTKASIEWEREREVMESTVDRLREEREILEEKLGEEKVRWLGVRSPPLGGGNGESSPGATSTGVLKQEFKKMMRDMRAESVKNLRVPCPSSYLPFLPFHPIDLQNTDNNGSYRQNKPNAARSKTNSAPSNAPSVQGGVH